ncbi:ProQ/FINO family protein [Xenorhabdus bovienii]|uniref:ProQ/FINO family protein n=1 Tax=Xenorhabdus bovienii TaxID=40576 RepID=UPI0023B3597C|nr:ProQ/FINO family protein [Xenorhabdus bovienii]MDE9459693.1 ProQ/FINO family protein [Xenorhabdus bovienii]MDE9488041.1 ProQ/FINO family protein [Xenorhabdus bovienii]MDE9516012.1 ProQ/FINO family protein [Xenorhabdus bovienii]
MLEDLISDAKALVNYTCRYLYQKTLAKGGKRYGLDGKADGVVTNEQQVYSKGLIVRRDAKAALARNSKKS